MLYEPDYTAEDWAAGSPHKCLVSLLRGSSLQNAEIDPLQGEFVLLLPSAINSLSLPLRFHPAEFQAQLIRDEKLRASVADNVEVTWRIMREEFARAVHERCCTVLARSGSVLDRFSLIPPDVFRYFEVTDWIRGVAVAESGERLFSIHVAPGFPPSPVEDGRTVRAKHGSLAWRVCDYLQRTYPNGRPAGLSYAALHAELKSVGVHASEATVRQAVQKFLGWR
jgi:hypothetical protein